MKGEATKRKHSRPPIFKPVHVTSDDGQVDEPNVTINKDESDQVTWFAHGASTATIVFSSSDGSPFEETTFIVPRRGSISSGPAINGVKGNSYKYTVAGQKGANDPVVIIDP